MTVRFASTLAAAALALGAVAATPANAASKEELDARATETLNACYQEFESCAALGKQAYGMLIFPDVTKAGAVIGGQYGEGVLRRDDVTQGYYKTEAASIGAQVGIASHSEVLMFMSSGAYDRFVQSDGWEAGVDASITVINDGATLNNDTNQSEDKIVGFIFGESGLMAGLSLEGSKFTQIDP